MAIARAMEKTSAPAANRYPIQPPKLMPGVLPKDVSVAPVMAMDQYPSASFDFALFGDYAIGFPGYAYLANLTTRAEYRGFASSLANEITREGITITSTETAGDDTKARVTALDKRLKEMKLMALIRKVAEDDAYYGRGQIYLNIDAGKPDDPLPLSPKTIKKDANFTIKAVEAMWTTPAVYNTVDPTLDTFYKPTQWYMLGKKVHSHRLLTVITREVSDILKPAFNFSGISLSQQCEPYVNNWLRTRQAVSDLVDNFSTTALKTDMGAVLQDGGDGASIIARAQLFTATRNNRGLMILDNEREDLVQQNAPLSSLDKLQAQSQEQMCSASHQPAVILTGLEPAGLNASSEGTMRAFYDWIAGQQNSYYYDPIQTIINITQLVMFGEIDPDITFHFNPLYQMTPDQISTIRKNEADRDAIYIDRGVISADEAREKLARDPESGYHGLQINRDPEEDAPEVDEDKE